MTDLHREEGPARRRREARERADAEELAAAIKAETATLGPSDEPQYSGAAERVPDRPCPKCGSDGVSLHYCRGGEWHGTDDRCNYGEPEHFHRRCRRCGYWWRTNDVIKAVVRR